jgi:hypothetical protein
MLTEKDAGPRYPSDQCCKFVKRDGQFDIYRCKKSIVTGYVWRYGPGEQYTTVREQVEAMQRNGLG